MNTIRSLSLCVLLLGGRLFGADVTLSPIPPVGSEITNSAEGVISIKMDRPGTVVLGYTDLEPPTADYIIFFTAEALATDLKEGSDVALAIYAHDGKFTPRLAYSGGNLIANSKPWKLMHTRFLANAGHPYNKISIAMSFNTAGAVQIRNLKVFTVTRTEFDQWNKAHPGDLPRPPSAEEK